jgi:glucokinase
VNVSDYALGLDVGGTKIASGLVGPEGAVIEVATTPTAGLGRAVVDQLATLIARYRDRVGHVGVAVPGPVDPRTGVVRRATNLGWENVDLARDLGREVYFDNDATAAAWAEYRFGTGQAGGSVVMITVGTGIGGGIVVNGDVVRGHTGAGGEVGHFPLVEGGRPCECGCRGCFEQYASGRALQRAAITAGFPTGQAALAAAAQGDPGAQDLVRSVAGHLVRGIMMLTAALDPAAVLLGGGLGTDESFLPYVRKAAESTQVTPPRSRVPIRAASLGPLAGVIGVADLARPR